MSYEGYDKWLCRRGHLHMCDAFDSPFDQGIPDDQEFEWHCPTIVDKGACGEPIAWWMSVDETNGPDDDGICPGDVELEIKTPSVTQMCNLGHAHFTQDETYKIPAQGGHRIEGDL